MAANGRRGRPQGKCHRKQTAQRLGLRRSRQEVRVKGCGKSAPRVRRRTWQGKPHREQDQIGVAGRARQRAAPGPFSDPPPGLVARGAQQWASQMNGRRGGTWPTLGKPVLGYSPDRTRLTGRLVFSSSSAAAGRGPSVRQGAGGAVAAPSPTGMLTKGVAIMPLPLKARTSTTLGPVASTFKVSSTVTAAAERWRRHSSERCRFGAALSLAFRVGRAFHAPFEPGADAAADVGERRREPHLCR